ncbi:PREDICTED: uncharacterized protein LOC104753204 [Camelina sativa]|uniref:Uncharacterized protein LOC104753204 n=1 Tax=Camelina sativa TaxID=90675 RepID=A0ABM0WNS9_CAMSA|nr:PREDICTED: uncharacterized protein LOC104753204 [Camelina sativa]
MGNGKRVSFWHDWWTPFGPLINFLGPTGPSQTGIPLHYSVAMACSQRSWRLRPARSPQAEQLHIQLTTVQLPASTNELDSFLWQTKGERSNKFNIQKTWEALRYRQGSVPWSKQVWYKGAIPRHAFLLWITHLNQLPTRSRLATWGMQIDTSCCICGLYPETRDHLFLHCDYSEVLWAEVTKRLGYRPFVFQTWEALLAWMDCSDASSTQTLRRLVSQAVIYALWNERNNRLHNNNFTPSHVQFKVLDRQVRDAILEKGHRKNFKYLLGQWLKHL